MRPEIDANMGAGKGKFSVWLWTQFTEARREQTLSVSNSSLGKWILKALRPKTSQFLCNHHYFFQIVYNHCLEENTNVPWFFPFIIYSMSQNVWYQMAVPCYFDIHFWYTVGLFQFWSLHLSGASTWKSNGFNSEGLVIFYRPVMACCFELTDHASGTD